MSLSFGTVGRAEEALDYAKTAVEQDPQSFLGRWELGIAYHWKGQYDKALSVLEPLWAESRNNWVALRIVPTYAKAGRPDRARAIYDELLSSREKEYVPPFVLAACEAALGDHEAAMASYRSAVERRDVLLALFPAWVPDLDPLRADPRFLQLMQRFNARS